MKTLFFDWDETLAEKNTTNLFPGAEELLKSLIAKGIKVKIITGRPGKDPTTAIFEQLKSQNINIDREDVMWAGAAQYNHNQTTVNDDKADYNEPHLLNIFKVIEPVRSKSDHILLVPEECFDTSMQTARIAREAFFKAIEMKVLGPAIKQAEHRAPAPSIQSSNKPRFFDRPVGRFILGAALVFAVIAVGAAITTAIALSGGTAVVPILATIAAAISLSPTGLALMLASATMTLMYLGGYIGAFTAPVASKVTNKTQKEASAAPPLYVSMAKSSQEERNTKPDESPQKSKEKDRSCWDFLFSTRPSKSISSRADDAKITPAFDSKSTI